MWLSQKTAGKNGINAIIKVIIRIALHTSCSHRPFFNTSNIYVCACYVIYVYLYTYREGKGREGEHIHFFHFFGVCWNGISGLHCRETRPLQGPNERRVSCSFICSVFLFYLLGTLAEKLQPFLTSWYFIKTVSPSVSTLLCYQVTRESDKGICVNVSQHTLLTQACVQHWK